MAHANVLLPTPNHPTIRTPFLTVMLGDDRGSGSVHLHLSALEFRALAAACIAGAEHMERAAQTEPVGEAA